VKKIILLLLSAIVVFANNFILHNEGIIKKKAEDKILLMVEELYEKTGVRVYISAKKHISKPIKEYEKELSKTLKKPYLLLTFVSLDRKIDIIKSSSIKVNTDRIIDDYILPIIVDPSSKIPLNTKYNAGIFNGVAEIVDEIAKNHNVKLVNSVGSDSKDTFDLVSLIVKIMLFITLALLVRVYLTSKK